MIRDLSARCDGARAVDGQGFNKVHARMGHGLAAADALTDKQAAVAVRLSNFYKNQFSDPDQRDIANVYARWEGAIKEEQHHATAGS